MFQKSLYQLKNLSLKKALGYFFISIPFAVIYIGVYNSGGIAAMAVITVAVALTTGLISAGVKLTHDSGDLG